MLELGHATFIPLRKEQLRAPALNKRSRRGGMKHAAALRRREESARN